MSMHVLWKGYLKRHARLPGPRILLRLGGDTPSQTRAKINAAFCRDSDEESLSIRTEALELWTERFKESRPVVDMLDPADWKALPHGGHQRKTHLGPSSR